MLSEEEKKAIKELKEFAYNPNGWFSVGNAKKILNLIEKQQQKLEQEKEKNKRNKKIILDKLDKLKDGIENDFPITLGERQPLWEENKTDYISKDKIRELPRTEYCNAECLMNGIYVDWDYIKELLEEE